jgi:hypothetical protein
METNLKGEGSEFVFIIAGLHSSFRVSPAFPFKSRFSAAERLLAYIGGLAVGQQEQLIEGDRDG